MSRAKTGVVRRRRHKKILKATKGYRGTRSKLFKRANEAFLRAGEHAYIGRRLRRRDMRTLWIIRLKAALEGMDLKYSTFINQLKRSKIELDRKVLAEIAISHPKTFKAIVEKVSSAN
jgi:large subunit ribosomal protein L20